eukprot:c18632_g2_i2.p1 GENE.c18632_g2_i2~~c18632_g2_i2.p1  ORF type:complete len:372 (+),score=145.29 c18632_g2_i2:90-1118(+)
MCALIPYVTTCKEVLLLVQLPFDEDLRSFEFPSPQEIESFQPTSSMENAAADIIQAMNLEEPDRNEEKKLHPKYIFDPIIQRFHTNVWYRILTGKTDIQEIDDELYELYFPDKKLLQKAKPAMDFFRQVSNLTEVEGITTGAKRQWDALSISSDLTNNSNNSNSNSLMNKKIRIFGISGNEDNGNLLASTKVTKVSDLTPVEDFNSMIDNPDPSFADLAINQMKEVILNFVKSAVTNAFLVKAVDCMRALRNGCIKQEEPNVFNLFLKEVKKQAKLLGKEEFLELLDSNGIFSISNEEPTNPISTSSYQFVPEIKQQQQQVQSNSTEQEEDVADAEDLLADL